jgi:hypothetical protein
MVSSAASDVYKRQTLLLSAVNAPFWVAINIHKVTKLSSSNRKRYFTILIIDRLISVVKLEILLIRSTIQKKV